MTEMARELNINRSTVSRHINSLTNHFNIKTFKGGIDRGGVQLVPEQKVSIEKLNSDDLQLIISKLSLLQNDNPRIKAFIHNLSTLKEFKEMENESFNEERQWAL